MKKPKEAIKPNELAKPKEPIKKVPPKHDRPWAGESWKKTRSKEPAREGRAKGECLPAPGRSATLRRRSASLWSRPAPGP